MTEHENKMLKTLCARISAEQDPIVFTNLARISAEQDPIVFTNLLTELDAFLEKLATRKARSVGFESET